MRPSQPAWYALLILVSLFLLASHAAGDDTRWHTHMEEAAKASQNGQYAEAEMWYRAALDDVAGSDSQDPRLVSTLHALAVFYHAHQRYTAAEPVYKRVLTLLEATLPPEHPAVATTLNNLAVLYDTQGEYTLAEPLYQRALTLLEHVHGPEHTNVAAALGNYADCLRKLGRGAEAEALEARAKAIWAQQGRSPLNK